MKVRETVLAGFIGAAIGQFIDPTWMLIGLMIGVIIWIGLYFFEHKI